MTRRSDSDAEKMTGTSIDSPKLDSLEPAATAILQQNWRGGREMENRRGKSEKYGRLVSTQYFIFAIKTILKISVTPLLCTSLASPWATVHEGIHKD